MATHRKHLRQRGVSRPHHIQQVFAMKNTIFQLCHTEGVSFHHNSGGDENNYSYGAHFLHYGKLVRASDNMRLNHTTLNPVIAQCPDRGQLSDGFHSFDSLYESRCVLAAGFFNLLAKSGVETCKSWKHADGEPCFGGGWFIVMANLPTGQISFHYPERDWERFRLPEKETGFVWDGHETADVHNRILSL
jgi:hypothetical protein